MQNNKFYEAPIVIECKWSTLGGNMFFKFNINVDAYLKN